MLANTHSDGINDQAGFPVFFTIISDNLRRYDSYEVVSKQIATLFPPSQYPTVVDICCGIGKMSHELFNRGYNVSAIDLSHEQLEIAKTNSPGPTYFQSDMKNISGTDYDLLINIYTSFGYYNTEEEDLSLFNHWFNLLRPGGVLLMELADMDRARNRIDAGGCLVREDNSITEYLHMDWENRLLKVEYHMGTQQWSCLTRLYEKEKLKDELLKAGFNSVSLHGDFELKNKESDDNLIIIARKDL